MSLLTCHCYHATTPNDHYPYNNNNNINMASNQGLFLMALKAVKERVFSPYFSRYDAEAFLNENIPGLEAIKNMLRHSPRVLQANIVRQNKNSMFNVVNTKRLKQMARLIGMEVSRKATHNISEKDAACIVYATAFQELSSTILL
jgi:hypothetical protein